MSRESKQAALWGEAPQGRNEALLMGLSNSNSEVANAVRSVSAALWGEQNEHRVTSLTDTKLAQGMIVETVGVPIYVSNVSDYAAYGLMDTGWYIFARVASRDGSTVTAETTIEGDAGHIMTIGESHIDVAVRFGVTAESQLVTINWGSYEDQLVFKATDLAVRNLDYRTTFYVYDAEPFVTWQYALTTDTTFVADKNYYTEADGVYTLAEVTAGEAVTANTYYNHSKIIIEGLPRNVTYLIKEIIDCPMEFILPAIEDDTHGCWFEIRCRHAGEYSMTLTPPEGVKIATEHTQKETAGLNAITLHYTSLDGVKLWRFLNTHSSIPSDGGETE